MSMIFHQWRGCWGGRSRCWKSCSWRRKRRGRTIKSATRNNWARLWRCLNSPSSFASEAPSLSASSKMESVCFIVQIESTCAVRRQGKGSSTRTSNQGHKFNRLVPKSAVTNKRSMWLMWGKSWRSIIMNLSNAKLSFYKPQASIVSLSLMKIRT